MFLLLGCATLMLFGRQACQTSESRGTKSRLLAVADDFAITTIGSKKLSLVPQMDHSTVPNQVPGICI